MVDIQKQEGGADCGVFAIAVATAIAFGFDPTTLRFSQREMRGHLELYLYFQQLIGSYTS